LTGPESNAVERTIRISARPATVWRYWTDPERICDWWGASAELDPRPGGICLVRLGGDAVMRGEFVELIPYRRIVFTLGWEPADGAPPVAPGSTTVTITLTEDDGDTILTLRHTGLPPAISTARAGPTTCPCWPVRLARTAADESRTPCPASTC
jgi:uncharacterized protein YndB with AHSA1/START domain